MTPTGMDGSGDPQAEMIRILRAAGWGALSVNEHGRYVIAEDKRPDRKTREKAIRNGWIGFRYRGRTLFLTPTGQDILATLEATAPDA